MKSPNCSAGALRIQFLLFEYTLSSALSLLSTRLIPEVPGNYRVVKNRWKPGSLSVVQQRLEICENNSRNASQILVKHGCYFPKFTSGIKVLEEIAVEISQFLFLF